MPYLAIKKIKGRHYGYVQESFREGGQVRTRTVEYLGAIDPAVMDQVRATRQRLGQLDTTTLVASVKAAMDQATASDSTLPDRVPAKEVVVEAAHNASLDLSASSVDRGPPQETAAGAEPSDRETPSPAEPEDKKPKPVITTDRSLETSATPTAAKVTMPDDLASFRVSRTAVERTGARFARQLQLHGANPTAMPQITIRYGHPDRMEQRRDGSYVVYASRRTQNKRHQLNKTKLWSHYRQALANAYLDTLAQQQPGVHHQLQVQLDASHHATTRLLAQSLAASQSPLQRMGLSLQLRLWHRLPQSIVKKQSAEMFGQATKSTVNDWRREAAFVLAEAQRPGGWQGFADRQQSARRKLKSAITRRRNQLDRMSWGQQLSARLSGQRRRLLREIIAHEQRLQAVDQLDQRLTVLRQHFPL